MATAVFGVDILIHVNLGTEEMPEWQPVGGQRGATLSETRDTFEKTSKTSPGQYREYEYGFGEWTISCDGVYIDSETAFGHLVDAMRNRDKVLVKWTENESDVFEGEALVTSRSLEAPYESEATYSLELQGTGEPTVVV